MPMVMNIQGLGIQIENMVMVLININKLKKDMMANGQMEKKVVKENSYLLKVIFMKENSNKDLKMAMEKLNTNQVLNLKVNLLIIKLKVKDK